MQMLVIRTITLQAKRAEDEDNDEYENGQDQENQDELHDDVEHDSVTLIVESVDRAYTSTSEGRYTLHSVHAIPRTIK